MYTINYKLTEDIYKDLIFNGETFLEKYLKCPEILTSFSNYIFKNSEKNLIKLLNAEIYKLKIMNEDNPKLAKIRNAMLSALLTHSKNEQILLNLLSMSLQTNLNECVTESINRINTLYKGIQLEFEPTNHITLKIYDTRNTRDINIILNFFADIRVSLCAFTHSRNQLLKKFFKNHGLQIQILDLRSLEKIDESIFDELKGCPNLKSLFICSTNILSVEGLGHLSKLQKLDLSFCERLTTLELSQLPALERLELCGCEALTTLYLNDLPRLQNLNLYNKKNLISIELCKLPKLQHLNLLGCKTLTSFNLRQLSNLQNLKLSDSKSLTFINLDQLLNLKSLDIQGCDQLKITEQFLSFLKKKLESCEAKVASYWSRLIIDRHTLLKIHENHPLFQKAIEIKTLTDWQFLNHPKNPYNIYKKLEQILQKEKNSPLKFPVSVEMVNHKKINLNIPFLQKDSSLKAISRSDLPCGINLQTLRSFFSNLEKRLAILPVGERQNMENKIEVNYLHSLSELKSKILAMEFILNSLALPNESEEPIDPITLYLYAILKVIKTKSSVVKQNEFFSPQEEMFLAFATSINSCVIGQKDGIVLFYNNLEPQDKIGNYNGKTQTEDKIKNYIKESYQTLLNNVFAKEKLIANLEGRITKSQISHQTLFLKNRFHRVVGLHHDLKFDPYTGILNDTLLDKVNKSPEEVVTKIFTYASAKELCELIKREMNQLCKSGNITYIELSTYLEHIYNKPGNKIDFVDGLSRHLDMSINESGDFDFKGITEEGIVIILKEIGYIEINEK